MRKPEIWLVRHGETDWSRKLLHTGRTDIPLTDAGRAQATALGPRLAERSFERVLVSPLSRATDTAELAGVGERAERRDELLEFEYGDYEGMTTEQIRETAPGWTIWTHRSPGGETPADVAARLDPLIAELRAGEGETAIVAHGHLLRVLAARWIGLPADHGARLALATGTLSLLGWERDTAVIRRWNA